MMTRPGTPFAKRRAPVPQVMQPEPVQASCLLDRRRVADRDRWLCRAASHPRPGPGGASASCGANQLRIGQLLVTGIALGIDNLAVSFAPGAYHVNLAAAAVIIGAVSVTLSLAGLELGDRLAPRSANEAN